MKLYIAGGSDERLTVVRPVIDALPFEVTYDWTRSPGYDRPLTPSETTEQARLDLDRGIALADLVWIMAPAVKSEGAATELGAALALGKTVFVSGPHAIRESRIFYLLASRIFATHGGALRAILRLACPTKGSRPLHVEGCPGEHAGDPPWSCAGSPLDPEQWSKTC